MRRVDALLREEIARVVNEDIKDPRVGFVTVMGVESAPDLRSAEVWVSVLGSDEERDAALDALRGAAGFIRARVGNAITLKYLPELRFQIDRTLDRAARIEGILSEIERERVAHGGPVGAGIVLVDKPSGPSSHDVVARLRRALSEKRVGHFGTLDPFATGLLVCGVGSATRLEPFCSGHDKEYEVGVRLGATSTTDDPEGEIDDVDVAVPPDRSAVEAACREWVGVVAQRPPNYSAKHVEGRRAYALARSGTAFTLDEVDVRIESIEVKEYDYPDVVLVVRCGSGTYMRALARDIGETLGTGGYCRALRRTRSGPFDVASATTWEAMSDPDLARAAMQPASTALSAMPAVRLDESGQAAVAHGRAIRHPGPLRGAGWVRIDGPRGFIGLGESQEGPDGWRIQPRRILFPDGERA